MDTDIRPLITFLRLSSYCQDDTIDVIPLAFLYVFLSERVGSRKFDFANVGVMMSCVGAIS